ncbi:MAG: hypothetical protein QXU28_04065 [Nitrososphaerota archaeon]
MHQYIEALFGLSREEIMRGLLDMLGKLWRDVWPKSSKSSLNNTRLIQ